MCGGGSSDNGAQLQLQQAQMVQQADLSAKQLAEQQREFDAQQQQNDATLANTKALQDKNKAQIDQQAMTADVFAHERAQAQSTATKTVNDAFAQFTPEYYAKYTKDYTDHYAPQVEQQFGQASNQTVFGLARNGDLDSSTAAEQFGELNQEHGQALADVDNAAIGATQTLRNNVLGAKQNLMSQATSDATIGSPVVPGSIDAVQANFNNVSNNLSQIGRTAGDTITTLQATPSYSSLGSLFGSAAGAVGAGVQGNTNYSYGQAFNAGAASAANPTTTASAKVSG